MELDESHCGQAPSHMNVKKNHYLFFPVELTRIRGSSWSKFRVNESIRLAVSINELLKNQHESNRCRDRMPLVFLSWTNC